MCVSVLTKVAASPPSILAARYTGIAMKAAKYVVGLYFFNLRSKSRQKVNTCGENNIFFGIKLKV